MPTTVTAPAPSPAPVPVPRRDGGQITVAVAGALALTVLLALGVARLGSAVVDRTHARTAADAAALAAVIEEPAGGGAGHRRAVEIAGANGATVVSYRVVGTAVEVEVRVGSASATSRADRTAADPRDPP